MPFFLWHFSGCYRNLLLFFINYLYNMGKTGDNKNLTDKQEAFCQEYIKDSNGTQAAIRAGYSSVSHKSVGTEANRMLKKPYIIDRIAILRGAVLDMSNYGRKELLAEYKSLAHTNIVDFVSEGVEVTEEGVEVTEEGGKLTMKLEHFRKLPRRVTAAVKSFKTKPNGEVEFSLYDKVKAMEGLGKHFGIFEMDNAQKASSIDLSKLTDKELLIYRSITAKAQIIEKDGN